VLVMWNQSGGIVRMTEFAVITMSRPGSSHFPYSVILFVRDPKCTQMCAQIPSYLPIDLSNGRSSVRGNVALIVEFGNAVEVSIGAKEKLNVKKKLFQAFGIHSARLAGPTERNAVL